MNFSIQKYQHVHWPRTRELIPNRVKFWNSINWRRRKHNKTKWQKDLLNLFPFRERCFVEKELNVVLSVESDLPPWLIFLDGVRLDFYLVPKYVSCTLILHSKNWQSWKSNHWYKVFPSPSNSNKTWWYLRAPLNSFLNWSKFISSCCLRVTVHVHSFNMFP